MKLVTSAELPLSTILRFWEIMKIISLVVTSSLFLSSFAALAAESRYTATLAQPLSKRKEVIVEHNLWRCEGSLCVLASRPGDISALRNCRALRRQVGELTAYGAPDDQFDSDKLAKCNAAPTN
jgi:hypothetical protein